MHLVTKTYGHDLGLSACFRQWRAISHCRFLHGYALSVKLTFSASILDENGWVLNFGGLKDVRRWLEQTFDHKLLVAEDDPCKDTFHVLGGPEVGLAQILVIPAVGCEGFASYIAEAVHNWLADEMTHEVNNRGLRLFEVEVREHGANSAIWRADA